MTTARTLHQEIKIILTGFNARVENVGDGVLHIHTSPAQLEYVRETILKNVPVSNVLAYDDYTLGVFPIGYGI